MRARIIAPIALLLMFIAAPSTAFAQAAPCQFTLGFASLRALIPTQTGGCLENENHNPKNGDGLQHTTGGLMVWRKSDNWTAFTDGYHTWINGPNGLQERRNDQLFPWEKAEQAQAPTTTLLDQAGTGDATTDLFSPRGNYDVAFQYDCSASTSPVFYIRAQKPNNGASDDQVFKEERKGQGVAHFTTAGPHTLGISTQSECTWHVVVTG